MPEYSYNGWLASRNPADFGGLASLVVAGESFAPGVRAGDVHTVLQYVVTQMHLRVEPVYAPGWHTADDWGYSYRKNRNANNLSCHASGTGVDYNATRHPNGKKNTFTPPQRVEIKKICAEVDNVVRWGGMFTGTPDDMHLEIIGTASQVARVAARIRAQGNPSTPDSLLRQGASGDRVRRLQAWFNAVFPSYSRLAVDGEFGTATTTVVKEFQSRMGLDVDGVVGPRTEAAMRSFGWK